MIDLDLSHQLHSLAATVDEPFDLAALHRRISMQSRRRAAVKVGFAGASVAAVVGGLFVVREQRPGPVDSGLAAASSVSSQPASQVDPPASPECGVVLAGLRAAKSTPDTVVRKEAPTSADDVPGLDFKGIVTILTIDGQRLTFRVDEPKVAPPTTGAATVDAATVWADGPTHLDQPPSLQVGEQLGLATVPASDGVEHVVFIDISASATIDETPAPDKKLATPAESDPSAPVDTKIVVPGDTLPPGPTGKSRGTITAVDTTSISVSLDDVSGQARTVAIDLASTPFYAGDAQCMPGALTIGAAVGVAFHFGDAGNLVSDDVMLIP